MFADSLMHRSNMLLKAMMIKPSEQIRASQESKVLWINKQTSIQTVVDAPNWMSFENTEKEKFYSIQPIL